MDAKIQFSLLAMAIWYNNPDLEKINAMRKGTLLEALGITITEVGDGYVKGTMPVGPATIQPFGLLHGGASAALAETLGSLGAHLCLNPATHRAVGTAITANHLKSATAGMVHGLATPIHIGKSQQVWNIDITNDDGALVCSARLTVAVVAVIKA